MPTSWHMGIGGATEPKPSGTLGGGTRDFGSYSGPHSLIPGDPDAVREDYTWLYPIGSDANVHRSEAVAMIGPPMAAQTVTGDWGCNVYGSISAVPAIATFRLEAALFRYKADDSGGVAIGTMQQTPDLTRALTSYSLTFATSTGVTFTKGDRLLVEVSLWVDDDPGVMGLITALFRRNAAIADCHVTTPDAAQLVWASRRRMVGAGN